MHGLNLSDFILQLFLDRLIEDVRLDASLLLQSNPGQGFSPKADPKVTDGSPVTDGDRVEADSSPIAAGDQVEIVLSHSRYQGQTGIVRRVFQDQGLTVYTVQIKGGKRIDYQRSDLKLVT